MRCDVRAIRINPSRDRLESGMSLIEMLVTLVVMSLVLTITIQSGVRLVEQWRIRDTEKRIVQSFEDVRRNAMASRSRLVVSAKDLSLPENAENWTVELSETLVFSKSGLCNSGVLTIAMPDRSPTSYRIAPPGCVPQPLAR